MATEQPAYSFTNLTLPGIAAVPQPEDINNRGDIVGIYNDAGGQHGFLLREGEVITLDVPGGSGTSVGGINDAGEIVGSYLVESGADLDFHGFLYRDGAFTTLDIPGASDTQLTGINNLGQIVAFASASDASTPSGGFLYEDGRFARITVPDLPDAFLVPADINDEGAITGVSGNDGFLLADGRLTLLDHPSAAFFTRASGINNEGQVVGEVATGRAVVVGFLYRDGEFVALDPPLPPGRPPSTDLAGINDAGEIVGTDASSGPGRTGFLATPDVPAPQPAVDWNALAAEVQANFAATGQWFANDGTSPPPTGVDWDALAAQVQANFAATGQWFL